MTCIDARLLINLFFSLLVSSVYTAEQRIIYTQSAALLRALWNNLILPPFKKSGL